MTNRFWSYRTVATLVASVTVSAGALALASNSSGVQPKDGKLAERGKDRAQRSASDAKRAKTRVGSDVVRLGSVDSQTPKGREKGKGNRRIALKPLDSLGKRPSNNNPYLVPAKELVTSEAAAYQLDPVTGIGLMVSPDGTPIFLQLRPSKASAAWVGKAMGDEWSTALILETKWGPVGTLHSRVWGNFRFLPIGKGNVRITSTNQKEIGICGNGSEWEIPVPEFEQALARGGLAGGGGVAGGSGNCWTDTEDQTEDGISYWLNPDGAKNADGQSYTVNTSNGLCTGTTVQEVDTPDIPDWRLRDYGCTGFPTFDRIIDILFAYSQDALDGLGGDPGAMHALAVFEIALLNESFLNSSMRTRARLVGVELGMWANPADGDGIPNDPYPGTGSPPADLNRLVMEYYPNTQWLTNVFEDLRDERGADIVTLVVSNNNTGVAGIAMDIPSWEAGGMSGASAAKAGAVYTLDSAGSGTYQHEIGHLLGGCHAGPNADIEGQDQFATCPCRTPETGECTLDEPHAFPDEYHYGHRFWVEYDEVPPTEEEMMRTLMAYEPEDGEAIRVFHFSNPNVQVFQTNSDTGVIDQDGDCCIDDGESAANSFVMDFWITGQTNPPVDPTGFTLDPGAFFANGAGVAQYRCRTIPYDCDQNGRLDTEEIDEIHPDGNENGLTDLDGDRVADGCLPNQCLGSSAIVLDEDPLAGPGGTISDLAVFESVAVMPVMQDDDSWAFQVLEVELQGVLHPDFTQLNISLVHRPPGGEEDVFVLSNCVGGQLDPEDPTVLNGTYRFVTPTLAAAFETLATPTLCEYADRAGENGSSGWIPAGTYQPTNSLTDNSWANADAEPAERRPENGLWMLRIVDHSLGGAGYIAGWNMTMAYLPYDSDCDGDGLPDDCITDFTIATDCNQNGESDLCELVADPLRLNDCDLNGRLDVCEDLSFLLDCGGGIWDADGSGTMDLGDVTYLNDNCPGWPTESNCRPDVCDIRADPGLDVNNNGMIDTCEPGGGGDEFDCSNRVFDSAAAGLTGAGFSTVDLGIASSTITVPVEPDDGTNDPVVSGAIVNGGVTVVLHDFVHDSLNDMEIRLTHTTNGFSVTVSLMEADCGGTGYFVVAPNLYTIMDGATPTLCHESTTGGVIPEGQYSPEQDLGSFIGMPAAGTWKLEIYDIYLGASGSLGSWDLEFGHRPPDNNNNGVPDLCEEP